MCLFTRFCHVGRAPSPASRTRMSDPHQLVRDHSLYFGRVSFADQNRSAQMSFALFLFRSKNVAQKCFGALYFSRRSFLEALGCAFMSFKFWHSFSSLCGLSG